MKMKLADLATQALRYLESLQQPLPDASDTKFYDQNEKDYQALLTLNLMGQGATAGELEKLANPKKVRIVKETKLDIDFEVMQGGKVIEKDFMDAEIFWNYVSTQQLVYLGNKSNSTKIKQEWRRDYKYTQCQPYWFKNDKIDCMKGELEYYIDHQLITEKQADSLEGFIHDKWDALTLN